jgi:hypothetical protein
MGNGELHVLSEANTNFRVCHWITLVMCAQSIAGMFTGTLLTRSGILVHICVDASTINRRNPFFRCLLDRRKDEKERNSYLRQRASLCVRIACLLTLDSLVTHTDLTHSSLACANTSQKQCGRIPSNYWNFKYFELLFNFLKKILWLIVCYNMSFRQYFIHTFSKKRMKIVHIECKI